MRVLLFGKFSVRFLVAKLKVLYLLRSIFKLKFKKYLYSMNQIQGFNSISVHHISGKNKTPAV